MNLGRPAAAPRIAAEAADVDENPGINKPSPREEGSAGYNERSSTAGCSTQSATYRRKPPAVPPSQTRWSKVSESWTTCRTASSPWWTHGLGMIRPTPEHGRLGMVDDRRGAVDTEHPVVVQGEGAAR